MRATQIYERRMLFTRPSKVNHRIPTKVTISFQCHGVAREKKRKHTCSKTNQSKTTLCSRKGPVLRPWHYSTSKGGNALRNSTSESNNQRTGVNEALYKDEYSISVTFGGVLGTSISILLNRACQSVLDASIISSKDDVPTSSSAF